MSCSVPLPAGECGDGSQGHTGLILGISEREKQPTFSPGIPMGPWGPGNPCARAKHRLGEMSQDGGDELRYLCVYVSRFSYTLVL